MKKIIVRIKGGLGNQLFSYAAARRLAFVNNAELVIDNITGFIRDRQYQRKYALDHFLIPCRKACSWERMEPFERYRRGISKGISKLLPFGKGCYVEQVGVGFDERVLNIKTACSIQFEGHLQSERYFKDIESTIRDDLRIIPPADRINKIVLKNIEMCNAIALHVRWFDNPDVNGSIYNVSEEYYSKAIQLIEERIDNPHYFLFSDDPKNAIKKLSLKAKQFTVIDHNVGDENAYADLWLMSRCKHYITANSTFSWWGAWLCSSGNKIIITPASIDANKDGKTSWGFCGQLPDTWIKI
jgi:hypothetical protein